MITGPAFGHDPSLAGWVGARLTGRWGHVTGTVPAGFDGYARILHPVVGEDDRLLRWSEVAEAAGTQVHPLAQWDRVARRAGPPGGWNAVEPEQGNLHRAALHELLHVLRHHTATPEDCWFCLWNGYGWLRGSPSVSMTVFADDGTVAERDVPPAFPASWLDPAVEVRHPGREYLLGRGPLESALGIGAHVTHDWFEPQSPNLFWPADRGWCVATEIDFDSTLVGGSHRLIDELLGSNALEVWPVDPGDSLQLDADHLN